MLTPTKHYGPFNLPSQYVTECGATLTRNENGRWLLERDGRSCLMGKKATFAAVAKKLAAWA